MDRATAVKRQGVHIQTQNAKQNRGNRPSTMQIFHSARHGSCMEYGTRTWTWNFTPRVHHTYSNSMLHDRLSSLCTKYKPPISREHVKAAQEEKSRRRPKKGQRRARHLFKIEKLPIFPYSRPAWFFFNVVSFEVQILVGTSVPESDFLISVEKSTTPLVTAARRTVAIYYHSRSINHLSPLNSHHKRQARKKQQQFLLA